VRRILWIAALTCCLAASGPNETTAQTQGSFHGTVAERILIGGELKLGITLAEQALGALRSTSAPDELQRAGELTLRSYVQWNRALQGVQHLMAKRTFEDPLLQQTVETIDQARAATGQAHSLINGAAVDESERASSIAAAIQLLWRAIALAQQAMDLV